MSSINYAIINPKPLENSPFWSDIGGNFDTVLTWKNGTRCVVKWIGPNPENLPNGVSVLTYSELMTALDADVDLDRTDPVRALL